MYTNDLPVACSGGIFSLLHYRLIDKGKLYVYILTNVTVTCHANIHHQSKKLLVYN